MTVDITFEFQSLNLKYVLFFFFFLSQENSKIISKDCYANLHGIQLLLYSTLSFLSTKHGAADSKKFTLDNSSLSHASPLFTSIFSALVSVSLWVVQIFLKPCGIHIKADSGKDSSVIILRHYCIIIM